MRYLILSLCLMTAASSVGFAQGRAENTLQLKAVQEETSKWTGRRLAGPAKLICDIKICSQMPIGKNLTALVNLKGNQLVTQVAIQAAWSRLKRTGFFSRIDLQFTEKAGQAQDGSGLVYLNFVGTGTVVIQTLDVEYSSWGSSLYPKQFVFPIYRKDRCLENL